MFRNYLYLLRCVVELKSIIENERIHEIYTQERDKLFISIPLKDYDNFHLIISTNAQLPYLTAKKVHHKAKKNTKNFFNEYLPDKIKNIEIAYADRIIKFTLTNASIFFLIRGPFTNVVLIDSNNNFFSFKKIEDDQKIKIFDELLQLKYIDSFEPLLNEIENDIEENVLSKFKFFDLSYRFGKAILNELKLRTNIKLIDIVRECFYNDIRVAINSKEYLIEFKPTNFYLQENFNIVGTFKSYLEALPEYLFHLYKLKSENSLYTEIQKHLRNEIEKILGKLNDLKVRIDSGSKESEYLLKGNLLLANISVLKKGMTEIEVTDYKNNKIKIDLDEKLSPQQNVDKYFSKAKAEKINFERAKKKYAELLEYYNYLLETKSLIDSNISQDELKKIKTELRLKSKMDRTTDKEKINFRHFIIDNKYHLYVGKDSHNNDELTLKFAKQNDYWFHARAVAGSHVVLRVENLKEGIPKNILKKAASIAAFYSKAKTSKLAPVSYTLKKYVVKRKGMEPGQVSLLREEVILVKPEIPAGSEMINEE